MLISREGGGVCCNKLSVDGTGQYEMLAHLLVISQCLQTALSSSINTRKYTYRRVFNNVCVYVCVCVCGYHCTHTYTQLHLNTHRQTDKQTNTEVSRLRIMQQTTSETSFKALLLLAREDLSNVWQPSISAFYIKNVIYRVIS